MELNEILKVFVEHIEENVEHYFIKNMKKFRENVNEIVRKLRFNFETVLPGQEKYCGELSRNFLTNFGKFFKRRFEKISVKF